MKYYFVLLLFSVITATGYSQNLEGEWKGNIDGQKIVIKFTKKTESTYSANSHSFLRVNGVKTEVVCKISGYSDRDSVFLEELEIVSPADFKDACLQLMRLKYTERKNKEELSGEYLLTNCNSQPQRIYFWRKKD